jgi:tRNA(fMet)-specific endonuclease VapC
MVVRRALIDTNIYSYALRGDSTVTYQLQHLDEIGFSVISIGELLTGFRTGTNERENRRQLAKFLDSPRVTLFLIDEETAEFYATTLTNLKRAGTPIPTNDVWIAAVAQRHGLPVLTKDQHFQVIPGLILIS